LVQGILQIPTHEAITEMLVQDLEAKSIPSTTIESAKALWNSSPPSERSLRYPLLVALSVSPLVLLLPIQLENKGIGIDKMFNVRYPACLPHDNTDCSSGMVGCRARKTTAHGPSGAPHMGIPMVDRSTTAEQPCSGTQRPSRQGPGPDPKCRTIFICANLVFVGYVSVFFARLIG
jgi:hypothetical protein